MDNTFTIPQSKPVMRIVYTPLNPLLLEGSSVSRGEIVTLKMSDIPEEVETLVNEKLSPGTYEVTFDGSNLPSGIYFYQLRSGDYVNTKKLMLLK